MTEPNVVVRGLLDRVQNRVGSGLVSAYAVGSNFVVIVLADQGFIDSLREMNKIWVELGKPEHGELWVEVLREADLPVIAEYGLEWNPYMSQTLIEKGSLAYGCDRVKIGTKGLLKARLMTANQWGASYENLPELIAPTQNTEEVREGILRDMRLLLQISSRPLPRSDGDLVASFFAEYEPIPQSIRSDIEQFILHPDRVDNQRSRFLDLLYTEHTARILLAGKDSEAA